MVVPSLQIEQLLVVLQQIHSFLPLEHHHFLQLYGLFDAVFEAIYFLKHQALHCHPSQVFLFFLGQRDYQAYELASLELLERAYLLAVLLPMSLLVLV